MSFRFLNFDMTFISTLINTRRKFSIYLKKYRKIYYILFGLNFILALTNTALIWFLGQPINYLVTENYTGLVNVLLSLLGIILINQTFQYFNTYRINCLSLDYIGELRGRLLSRFVNSKRTIANEAAKGDLLSRLSNDIDAMQRFIVEVPLYVAFNIFTIVLYSGVLIYLDWQLSLIAALLTPALFFHQKTFSKRKREAARNFYHKNGQLLAKEDEILSNIRLINAFNCQDKLETEHLSVFHGAMNWAKKERRLDAMFASTLTIVIYFCALFLVYQGIENVRSGELSISGLVTFLLYMGYMSVPLRAITQLFFTAQSDVMSESRLSEYLTEKGENETGLNRKLDIEKGEIRFDTVSWASNEAQIIRDLSFTIEAGKTVAIVGDSGVGKSTIANLLMGFIRPESGTIMVDQQDLSQFTVDAVREKIGIVWQSPMLFDGSIKSNMLLANSSATNDMINTALYDSDAEIFINKLPDGVETIIGTNGAILSAGQKQRLHIAQAFLRNSAVLIMDEATSALDSESEQKLVHNIKRTRKGKTTILIAHRYSSLRFADYIIYLNSDGSATTGTHEELLEKHIGYEQALNWQSGL